MVSTGMMAAALRKKNRLRRAAKPQFLALSSLVAPPPDVDTVLPWDGSYDLPAGQWRVMIWQGPPALSDLAFADVGSDLCGQPLYGYVRGQGGAGGVSDGAKGGGGGGAPGCVVARSNIDTGATVSWPADSELAVGSPSASLTAAAGGVGGASSAAGGAAVGATAVTGIEAQLGVAIPAGGGGGGNKATSPAAGGLGEDGSAGGAGAIAGVTGDAGGGGGAAGKNRVGSTSVTSAGGPGASGSLSGLTAEEWAKGVLALLLSALSLTDPLGGGGGGGGATGGVGGAVGGGNGASSTGPVPATGGTGGGGGAPSSTGAGLGVVPLAALLYQVA